MNLRDLVDAALELPVVPSFTRIGPAVRSRLERWPAPDPRGARGRVVVLTGATSGLGRSAADWFASAGARLVLVGRDAGRLESTRGGLLAGTPDADVVTVLADMGDLAAVRAAAATIEADHDRVDVLIHNAGALTADRRTSPAGLEETVAAQVVGPFLLTALLLRPLRAAGPGRVLTMSSGGLYSTGLAVETLQMGADYRGSEQYARAKRAQVTLNRLWADRVDRAEVVFHALHPGWADTPGVRTSLPVFARVVGPLLRTPAEGVDTLLWLAVDDGEPLRTSGDFWLDRRRRPLHRVPMTARSDTPERRAALWRWCEQQAGVTVATS